MNPAETHTDPRPKRADALRNQQKLVAAARDAFAERGAETSLEDIARRAGVGIGTLYRHFPTRPDLLEAVYTGEVEQICRSADDFAGLEPWDALTAWLRRYAGFAATKRALFDELLPYIGKDAEVFQSCKTAIGATGEALLRRAQDAADVRPDVTFMDVARMVGGIAFIPMAEPEDVERILGVALDGLRPRG
ncbi:MAG: TetR/AcrR family transcriptional regulator [Gaiellaceae bacterium]